jgi:ribosomal protein L12E/L44/L45/RPP1/RPP2
MTETRLPPLPSAAVEFNVLHDALAKGEHPLVAAAMAVAAASGDDAWGGETLKGKSKADLVKIAKAEKVVFADDATIPDLIAAIEGKRIADVLGPVAYSPIAAAEPEAPPTAPATDSQ